MYMFTTGHTRIAGTGVYIPEQRVTSQELMEHIDSERFDMPVDWMDEAMGIHERRVAPDDMLPSDMATHAARDAMERSGIRAKDIDVIVYAGIDRDYSEPATAHVVQDKLEVKDAVCVDMTNACHGFMNGIHFIDALIATGQAHLGLVVTGEKPFNVARRAMELIRETDDKDEFYSLVGGLSVGDAGAAMVLEAKNDPSGGFVGLMLNSRGQYNDLCVFSNRSGQLEGHMHMRQIVRRIVQMHAEMYETALGKLGWEPDDIDYFVHHQVGKKAFSLHAAYAHIPTEIMPNTISTMGNITSATIPVNFHKLSQNEDLQSGQKIFISGTGSGLSISQAGLIWDAA